MVRPNINTIQDYRDEPLTIEVDRPVTTEGLVSRFQDNIQTFEMEVTTCLQSYQQWRVLFDQADIVSYEMQNVRNTLTSFDQKILEIQEQLTILNRFIEAPDDSLDPTSVIHTIKAFTHQLKDIINPLLLLSNGENRMYFYNQFGVVGQNLQTFFDNCYLREQQVGSLYRQLSGEPGPTDVVATIVRDRHNDMDDSSTVPYDYRKDGITEPVFPSGSPRVITVISPENASAYEEAQAIVRTAIAPFLEAGILTGNVPGKEDIKVLPIKAIILFGSTNYNLHQPSDLDILIMYDGFNDSAVDFWEPLPQELSPSARDVLGEMNDKYSGDSKRVYSLVGDRITHGHSLDLTYMTTQNFIKEYGHTGKELELDLKDSREKMRDIYGADSPKVRAYAKWPFNIQQTIVETSHPIVIYGESPEVDGRVLFPSIDSEFLR